jgi:hypothetical protein
MLPAVGQPIGQVPHALVTFSTSCAGLLSLLRLRMPHNERRYAEEDRSSQSDCQ